MEMKRFVMVMVMVMAMLLSAPILPSSAQEGPTALDAEGPSAPDAEGPSAQDAEGPSTSCAHSISSICNTALNNAKVSGLCCHLLSDASAFDTECYCLALTMAQFLPVCDVDFSSRCSGSDTGGQTPGTMSPSETPESKMHIIIGASVAAVVVLVVSFIVGFICVRKRKSKPDAENHTRSEPNVAYDTLVDVKKAPFPPAPASTNKDDFLTPESLRFEFADLQNATNNFSRDSKIGRGGFGIVYKGTLPSGQQIAVKRLLNGSGGEGDKEFQTEVVLLAKLQHRNLVSLLGYCLDDDEALLVYEFVTNKSLDYFLFDSKKRAELTWQCRFDIIKGVSRGMMYLHEDSPLRTMHRDLKAGNVLLDAKMHPKIADFGVARICDVGHTHINPTRVVGTNGYMAPEYLFQGRFSAKSDVYSLGVLILEIVSGRRVSGSTFNQEGEEGLLSYAWRCWEDEKPMEVMDSMLKDSYSRDEVIKCVQLGLLCVQEDSKLRPTMSTIVHILNLDSGDVAISTPQHPPFVYNGSSDNSTTKTNTTDPLP